MSLQTVLRHVVEALDAAGVPSMLTGSLAGSYHGTPRTTQDIDLVVDASLESLLDVAARLRSREMYVSDAAVQEAVGSRGMFNVIDPATGWKIDFIVCKDRPFSRAEFSARETIEFAGMELAIARAEDVILAKLEWSKLGESERQLRDVVEIMAVQGSRLDTAHVDRWARELDVEAEWQRAQELLRRQRS